LSGTADPQQDYWLSPSTIVIPDGQPSVTITVNALDDAIVEPTESVDLLLQTGSGYSVGNPASATVSIIDNDTSSVTVSVSGMGDGYEAGAVPGSFMLTRSGSTLGDLAVSLYWGGDATPGVDYAWPSSQVIIPDGQSSVAVPFATIDDVDAEAQESVVLVVLSGAGYSPGPMPQASVRIFDNDVAPPTVVSVQAAAFFAVEGGQSGGFVVSRTGSLAGALPVNFSLGGTADLQDYTLSPSTVVIPAGESSVAVAVDAIDDALVEPTETVNLVLQPGPGYLIGTSAATVSIIDNDTSSVTVSVSGMGDGYEAGAVPGSFMLTRSGSTLGDLAVSLYWGGDAIPGTDYGLPPSQVVIPDGQSSVAVPFATIDDVDVEAQESVVLVVLSGAGYSPGPMPQASVRIFDNDVVPPTVDVSAEGYLAEPGGAVTGLFRLTRSAGSLNVPLTIAYTISGSATNGTDYNLLSGTASFAAGESDLTIPVLVIDDAEVEGTETVQLTLLTGTGYSLGSSTFAEMDLLDDDLPMVVVEWVGDATEPTTSGRFRVVRSGTTVGDLTVTLDIGGTATAGTDYTPLSSTVVIPDGQSSVEVDVVPLADNETEPTELVTIAIVSSSEYKAGSPGDTSVRIFDDPPSGESLLVVQAIDPVSSEYQTSTGRFRLIRLGDLSSQTSVPLDVAGDAVPTTDYGALPASGELSAGVAAVGFTVTPVSDIVDEFTESVILSLGSVPGSVVVPAPAYVLIRDKDQLVTIEAVVDAAEGGEPGAFRFTRSGDASQIATQSLVVQYTVAGTAIPGSDFVALSGQVVIPAGETETTLTLEAIDDLLYDPDETVALTLDGSAGTFLLGTLYTATVTIIDDDPRPVVWVEAGANASEAGEQAGSFFVRRSANLHGDLTVPLIIGGTAESGNDYSPLASDVFLPDGVDTVAITISPIDDALAESPETITLELASSLQWFVDGDIAMIFVLNNEAVAEPDEVTTAAENPIEIDVLANDTGVTSITSVTTPTAGTAEISDDGVTVLYTPPDGWTGTATFDYTAESAGGAIATETVTVTVLTAVSVEVVSDAEELNQVAGVVRFTRVGNTSGALTVSYTVGGSATAGIDYSPLSGTVEFAPEQTEVLVLVAPFNDGVADAGEDVEFTLNLDTNPIPTYLPGYLSTAYLLIKDDDVTAVNDTAVAQPGIPVDILVLLNDLGATSVASVGVALHGLVEQLGEEHGFAIRYTPNTGWYGEETFGYTAKNPDGVEVSAQVTVSVPPFVSIAATNPVAVEPIGLIPAIPGFFTLTRTGSTESLATPLTVPIEVTGTATHFGEGVDYVDVLSGKPLTTSMSGLGQVTFAAGATTAVLVIWPLADAIAEGPETVSVRVLDEDPHAPWGPGNPPQFQLAENVDATVTIIELSNNRDPVALPDRYLADNQPRLYAVLANDTDPDGDPLRVIAVEQPQAGGTVSIAENGQSVRFTPAPGATGQVTFRYQITDGRGGQAWATVTLDFVPPELVTAPTITFIGVDSTQSVAFQQNAQVRQAQATDRLSNVAGSVTVVGTAQPGQTVVVYRNDALANDTNEASQATADADGNWSLLVSGQLAEGVHRFKAVALATGSSQSSVTGVSRQSNTYQFRVDRTAPRIVVTNMSTEFDRLPELIITVTDENGLIPDGSRVGVIVAGVGGGGWFTLDKGQVRLRLTQPLPVNTDVTVTVSAEDEAGNMGQQPLTINVQSRDYWTYEFITPRRDPHTNVQLQNTFDIDRSSGIENSGGIGLIYNSDTVNPRPVFQFVVTAPNTGTKDLPGHFRAQLDLDIDGNGRFTSYPEVILRDLAVADLIPQAANMKEYGQTFTITLFSPVVITQTRALLYQVRFGIEEAPTWPAPPVPQFKEVFKEPPTVLPVVVNTGNSRFGAGWSLTVPQIVEVEQKKNQPKGAIFITPQSEGRWYAWQRQDAQFDYYTPDNRVDKPQSDRAIEWYELKRNRTTGEWLYTPTFPVTPLSSHYTEYRFNQLGKCTEIADLRKPNRVRIENWDSQHLLIVTSADGVESRFNFVEGGAGPDLLDKVTINGKVVYQLKYYEYLLPHTRLQEITGRDGTVSRFGYTTYTQHTDNGQATSRPLLTGVGSTSELITNPHLSQENAARLSPSQLTYVTGFRYSTGVSNSLIAVSTAVGTKDANGAVSTTTSTTTIRPAAENQAYFIDAKLGRPVTQITDPRGYTTTYMTRDLFPQYNPKPKPGDINPPHPAHRRYSETRVYFPDGSVAITHYDALFGEIILVADPTSGRVYRSRVDVNRVASAPQAVAGRKVVTFDVTGQPELGGNLANLGENNPLVVQIQDVRFGNGVFSNEIRQPNGDRILQSFSVNGPLEENAYRSGDLVVSSWSPGNTGSLATQITYKYAGGRVYTVIGENSKVLTEYSYTFGGQLEFVKHSDGRWEKYVYDVNGNLFEVLDNLSSDPAYGPVRRVWSDAAGRPLKFIERGGATTYFVYDKSGKLRYTFDPAGSLTRYSYSSDSRLISIRERIGEATELPTAYRYDRSGNLRLIVVGNRYITQIVHDGMNRPTETLESESVSGQITNYRYTRTGYLPGGRVAYERDPLGRVTRYSYAQDTRTLTTTAEQTIVSQLTGMPEVYRTVTVADQAGNIVEVRHPSGLVEKFQYGPGGMQLVHEVTNGANVPAAQQIATIRTENEYDKTGRLKAVIATVTPVGVTVALSTLVTEYAYQEKPEAGVSTRVIVKSGVKGRGENPPVGQFTVTDFDMTGAVSRQVDQRGVETKYQYLPDQRAVKVTTAGVNGARIQTAYADLLGRTVRVVDPDQNEVLTDYNDQLGIVTVRRIDGQAPVYTESITRSDVFGRTAAVFDANMNPTVYHYDALGNLDNESTLLGTKTFRHDAVGNVREIIDALGRVRVFAYDDLNQLTRERWLEQTPTALFARGAETPLPDVFSVTYTHDSAGLRQVQDSTGTSLAYTYDVAGRPLTESLTTAGDGGLIVTEWKHTYDQPAVTGVAGESWSTKSELRIKGPQDAALVLDHTVVRDYDKFGRERWISQTVGADARTVGLSYAPDWSSVTTTRQLTSGGGQSKALITTTAFKSLADSPARPLDSIKYTFNNETKEQFNYQYDNRGRITGVTAASNGLTGYGYDGADRLTSADHPGAQPDENFVGYDHAGNRLGNGVVIGSDNRLLEDAQFTYEYDAEGNLVAKTDKVTGDVTHYEWDYRNRLTAVWTETAGQIITSYIEYRYDPLDRRVSRIDTLAGTQSVFAWNGENVEAVLDGQGKVRQRFLHGPGVDEVLAVESFAQPAAAGSVGELRWTLLDHLNTIRGLISTDGTGLTFLGYDAYGRPLNPNAVPLFGFAGREWDAATGLYSNRARWLDPVSGRFISQDLIGLAGGLNRYEYALGNPNHYTDPSGEGAFIPWLIWGAIALTVGGTAAYVGYTSGPPSGGESLIPVWGAARSAGAAFKEGRNWSATGFTVIAALDVFLVRSILMGGGKLLFGGLLRKEAATVVTRESEEAALRALAETEVKSLSFRTHLAVQNVLSGVTSGFGLWAEWRWIRQADMLAALRQTRFVRGGLLAARADPVANGGYRVVSLLPSSRIPTLWVRETMQHELLHIAQFLRSPTLIAKELKALSTAATTGYKARRAVIGIAVYEPYPSLIVSADVYAIGTYGINHLFIPAADYTASSIWNFVTAYLESRRLQQKRR
jgi:RHS repeat-associated protein